MKPGPLLRLTRQEAGLSIRALSEQARTSASTIARIEKGEMDPTVGMLKRLLRAAGYEIELTTRPSDRPRSSQLRVLSDAWNSTAVGDRPDWTRLRAFLDHLARHPEDVAFAIRRAPRRSGSAVMDSLLAGIADKLADDHKLPRPSWTSASSRRLQDLWATPGTPRMRETARRATPAQLREHGLAISSDSLWRPRDTAGV